MRAKFHVNATCGSKVMALLLKNTFFIFTCLISSLYHWIESRAKHEEA